VKHLVKFGTFVGVALTLSQIAHASTNPRGAEASAHTSPSVSIKQNGQITISDSANQRSEITSLTALVNHQVSCLSVSKTTNDASEIIIRSNPDADYTTFMGIANWLEDCGIRSLRIAGQIAGEQYSTVRPVEVKLEMRQLEMLPVVVPRPPCAPSRPGEKAACPVGPRSKSPTFVSLLDGDLIKVSMGHTMKASTLVALAADIPESLGSTNPTDERVFVRADRHVTYQQFVELLDQLNRNGYHRLSLINEILTPVSNSSPLPPGAQAK